MILQALFAIVFDEHICTSLPMLGQVKLEDVFKSTQENMNQGPGSTRAIALVLGVIAMVLLLLLLQQRRRQQAIPKPVNHPGKLVKEISRAVSLKSAEVRCLRRLAEEQSCSTPLVMLLCPSLLAKSMQKKPPEQKKALADLVKRMGG